MENNVTMVAYSPFAQGLLTGKYKVSGWFVAHRSQRPPPRAVGADRGARPRAIQVGASGPAGPRSATFTDDRLRAIEPLLGLMGEIGSGHGGKKPSQIALNYILCKGGLPIPGVKTSKQVEEAAGALGWRMTDEEVRALEAAAAKVPASPGAPFENW